nr:hypothetical protein [uncultured Acetatifactor sp.]
MTALEIARRLAGYGQREAACQAYTLAIHESGGADPAGELEAAAYILQSGGNYKVSYTCFRDLYNRGYAREDILPLMTKVFYEPNVKMLRGRYERNCKLLKKYPYLFRRDFLPFEELPIRFYPYDDHSGYVPFYVAEERFGEYINLKNTVISRNFFKDLEKPILAEDVTSQYELEYLADNVRKSEYVGRENHIYLHYTDWGTFCAHLQCLNLRPLLAEEKIVFLIGDEITQYPIDFKERFGIDYSQYSLRPVGIREVSRLIWHTQLSTHNGGDFFNEVFDYHPNLLVLPSVMMSDIEESVKKIRASMKQAGSLQQVMERVKEWGLQHIVEELYRMRNSCTDKDIMVAMYLCQDMATAGLDPSARIAPAVFFQPHFPNIVYSLRVDGAGQTVLESENYESVRSSPLFRGFKYIKAFTPMRRFTTSHGATVRFMYGEAVANIPKEQADKDEKKVVVTDAVSERVLNRSFMVDPEDRLYRDSVLVRFEDGKLNSRAAFTALAAFLDLPYTESMTRCTAAGKDAYIPGNAVGFSTDAVFRTYDEYVNDDERYFIEYFLRDAYQYYGYDFLYYDGAEVDERRVEELVKGFTAINHYIRETWRKVYADAKVSRKDGEEIAPEKVQEIQEQLLENHIQGFERNRLENAKVLLGGLRFVNKNGQPLRMMPRLELDPALLEQPLYH